MENSEKKTYPSIAQSFGMVGILILAQFFFRPINMILSASISDEAAFCIYYIVTFVFTCWLFYTIRENKTGKKSMNLRMPDVTILFFIILGTITLIGIRMPIILIPSAEMVSERLSMMPNFFSILSVVVAAPVLEEFLCRGIILDGLLEKYSPWKSILISSLLFGIMHLNLVQFISTFLLGIFSGWVYYRTRNLLLSILIHAVNNSLPFLFMVLPISGEYTRESIVGTKEFIIFVAGEFVVSAILMAFCIVFLKRKWDGKVAESPDESLVVSIPH